MVDPVQPARGGAKVVPIADLMAIKAKLERANEELAKERKARLTSESNLKIAKLNTEDDEQVQKVKSFLTEEWDKLNESKSKFEEEKTGFQSERKVSQVKTLAEKYGLDVDALSEAEDPEKEAYRLIVERSDKEKKEAQEKKAPESPSSPELFESTTAGFKSLNIADINPLTLEGRKQLAVVESKLKQEAAKKG